MILKKNRSLGDSVLVIDASRSFIKVGKQNVLEEKDIAKIVDTYSNRTEIIGYSHLATREEIIENDYNMNIPRYVEVTNSEIPHDVDAHLFGGIPQKNIDALHVLNLSVPDILKNSLHSIRPGYVKLVKTVDALTDEVLHDNRIINRTKEVETKVEEYISKYWDLLRNVNGITNTIQLREAMLYEVKQLLSSFKFIDVYDGYQIIADIWKEAFTHDTELIAASDFYTVARTREQNIVTKGTGKNKREEQDGWIGSIIPNELIAESLYTEELNEIESKQSRVQEVDIELSELVEAAKVEDTDENNALYEAIKKNEEDEPQDSFENKTVKAELKNATKGTIEYDLLKKVDELLTEKAMLGKAIKAEEKTLKEKVYDRILSLTDEEIDDLVYEKWFGNVVADLVNLVTIPLKADLRTLDILNKRYANTLSELDTEIRTLEEAFETLMSEMVVE